MANNLPNDLQLFYRMFANVTKLLDRSDVPSIQLDYDRTVEYMDRNSMLPNAAKSLPLHFWRNAYPSLVFPDPKGVAVFNTPTHFAKIRGNLVYSLLSPTAQIENAVTKSRGMLDFIQRTIKRLTSFSSIAVWSGVTLNACAHTPSSFVI